MLKRYLFGVKNNIWKYFVFLFTGRRNFLPILFIYYLTLPNTNVVDTALISSIAFAFNFILEIPSGYISDVVGHKKTLILNKLFFVIAMLFFIFATGFWGFLIGMVCIQVGFAFFSGTETAFFHETLEELGEDDKFVEYRSKIAGWVSLLSAICIFALPFFTNISYKFPLIVRLFVDIIGLLVTISFVTPKIKHHKKDNKKLSLVVHELKGKRELLSVIFFAVIAGGIFGSDGPFRYIYLEDLGFVVKFIGAVMGGSRIIRFIFSRFVHKLEKIKFKYILIGLGLLLSGGLVLSSILQNPYIVGGFMALVNGIFRGIRPIVQKYIINHIPDKKYKATILSLEGQGKSALQILTIFGIGFVMDYSFRIGYFTLGTIMFVLLGTLLIFTHKYIQKK